MLTPQTNIRLDQSNDSFNFIQNQLVDNRQRSAKGAEGHAQPPKIDEVIGPVKAARAIAEGSAGGCSRMSSAAAAAVLSCIPSTEDPDDDTDDDNAEEVHFGEVSTVAGISLAAASAGDCSHISMRLPARIYTKRSRQDSASLSSTARASHIRNTERRDGSSGASAGTAGTDTIQVEIAKLSIYAILTNSTHGSVKMAIYNGVRRSAPTITVSPPIQSC